MIMFVNVLTYVIIVEYGAGDTAVVATLTFSKFLVVFMSSALQKKRSY